MRVLALLVCLTLPAYAEQKTYDLSLDAKPRTGQKSRLVEKNHIRMSFRANGQQVAASEEKMVFEATEMVMVADGKGNAEVRRRYQTAQRLENGQMRPYGFEGRMVTIKYAEGRAPTFTYSDGTSISESDLKALAASFGGGGDDDEPNAFEPKKRIAVGESWHPDILAVAEMFDPEMAQGVDVSKSKARFTLDAVETRSGADFGRMTGDVELAMNMIGPLALAEPLKMSMNVDVDACVDGSSQDGALKMKMRMQGASSAKAEGQTLNVDIDLSADTEMSRTAMN